jgi:hypothetical protein
MKRILSTILAVALLLGLGALAVLARGGGDILTPADNVVAAALQPQTAAAPVVGGPKYNAIALALDNGKHLASTLAADINAPSGALALQVLKWDPNNGYTIYDPLDDPPEDFAILVGDPVFVLMQGTSAKTYSIVGDVPAEGSVSFALVGNSTSCKYNFISLPLDQGSIKTAGQLASAINGVSPIGGVSQVLAWDPTAGYTIYDPNTPEEDFSVQIGYPYFVCMTISKTWPAP